MAYNTQGILGPGFTLKDTTAKHKLGTIAEGTDGSHWMYVQCSTAVTQYMYVAIDEDYTANPGTTALIQAGHRPGFAQVAFSAQDYGWVALGGSNINCLVGKSCAADTSLYTSNTTGYLDDASTSQVQLNCVAVAAVTTAGSTEIMGPSEISSITRI